MIVFKKSLLNELTTQAEIIGSNCTAALTFNDTKTAKEMLFALKANGNIDLARIYAKDGTLFADYGLEGKKYDVTHHLRKEGNQFGLNSMEVYHVIILDNEAIGFICIHSNLNALYANIFRQAGVFLAAILLSFFAVYMLSSRLQRSITGTISDLVHTMKNISNEKDYSVRATVQNKDELGALAEGFNEMLIQVQTRDSELEAYRKHLEELVDNRTEQLKTANEQLKGELTERKMAEENLKKSEKFVEDILASVDEAFVVVDREYRILMANRAYCEQTGKSPESILGRHCYEISHHADKPCKEPEYICGCKRTFETGEPTFTVHAHMDGKGKQGKVEVRTYAMKDVSGEIQSVIEVINDITEKTTLEGQLRHAQKMESIGTLAGGIAHDFNNILSAIIGYGHVTLMKMPQNDPLRLNIGHMLESADRAAALTQSLLTFSRKQSIDRKIVDLNILLKKVEKFLVRVIGEDVEVRMALEKTTLTIFADSGQLEQVLMNLATNARDAMPHGGLFTIETAVTELDNGFVAAHGYGKLGAYAMVSATDTGAGMNEETTKKIFEPFFTTKEVGKGTGLGLAMVYGIIKQHEGFINVYSEPGKGTTFRIYLPLVKETAGEEQKALVIECPMGGMETILLAEDDMTLRELTTGILRDMGYTVITASDGEEAVAKFREDKDRIQLLLFDLMMPKKSGKEAYDEIRKVMPDVPVLFASGYSVNMLREKSLIGEGAQLIYKPISPQALLKTVREVLDRKPSSVP